MCLLKKAETAPVRVAPTMITWKIHGILPPRKKSTVTSSLEKTTISEGKGSSSFQPSFLTGLLLLLFGDTYLSLVWGGFRSTGIQNLPIENASTPQLGLLGGFLWRRDRWGTKNLGTQNAYGQEFGATRPSGDSYGFRVSWLELFLIFHDSSDFPTDWCYQKRISDPYKPKSPHHPNIQNPEVTNCSVLNKTKHTPTYTPEI